MTGSRGGTGAFSLSVPKEHLRPVNHRVLLFVEVGARVESTCPVDALARVHVRTRERLVCFLATLPGSLAHLSIGTSKANVTQGGRKLTS